MKYNRLFFIKDNMRQFVTMYNLSYTNFFNLLDNNNQLLKDFEKFFTRVLILTNQSTYL